MILTVAGCHQGQPHPGVSFGYTAVLNLINLPSSNIYFNDKRDPRLFRDPIYGSYLLGKSIVCLQRKIPQANYQLLTIGGDHTVSYGSIIANLMNNPDIYVIWIDAHADINTHESSCSGNCHGMPVSYLLGLSEHPNIPKTINKLKPQNLIYFGLRSIDDEEEPILQDLETKGMRRFSAATVKNRTIYDILAELDDSLPDDITIHISLDIDSIDPEFTPATGTPVSDGLLPTDVMQIIKWAKWRSKNKCHLDVMEINPELSTLAGAIKTYNCVKDIIDTFIETGAAVKHASKCVNSTYQG